MSANDESADTTLLIPARSLQLRPGFGVADQGEPPYERHSGCTPQGDASTDAAKADWVGRTIHWDAESDGAEDP
jgi:hypothetical protein